MTSRHVTIACYLLLGACLVGLEVLARTTRLPVLPASVLLRRTLRHRSAQFGLVLAWWWIGWHFLVG